MHGFHLVIYTFMAILPISNPIGMAPIFLELTSDYSKTIRHKAALAVGSYCFFLITGILLVGPLIIAFFGISIPIIQLAGGLLVCHTTWGMLNVQPKVSRAEVKESDAQKSASDIAFFPLTMPLTVGAGSIAMTMAIASDIERTALLPSVVDYLSAIAGILGVSLTILICYRFADKIFHKLGTTGTNVVTKLSAFIILAVGVNIIWDGVRTLILNLH